MLRAAPTAVLTALLLILVQPAAATDWIPREDAGVAALDRQTGEVLWKAWRVEISRRP